MRVKIGDRVPRETKVVQALGRETLLHTLPAFIDVGKIEMIARVVTENVDVHTQADRFHRLQLERRHARACSIENIEVDPGREARIELAPEVALTSLEILVESLRGPVLRAAHAPQMDGVENEVGYVLHVQRVIQQLTTCSRNAPTAALVLHLAH